MIRFIQTGENFSSVYDARDAVLRFAETATPENRKKAELLFDHGEYRLTKPLVFDAKQNPALRNIELSMCCVDGSAIFTSNRALPKSKIEKTGDFYSYQFEKNENGEYPLFYNLYEKPRNMWQREDRVPLCTSPVFRHAFEFSGENGRDNAANMEGIYVPEEMANLIPEGDVGGLLLMIYVEWEFFLLHVRSVERDRTKLDEKGNVHVLLKIEPDELSHYVKDMNPSLQPKDREIFFLNHPAFLTKNSWCYDHKTGVLQFSPQYDLEEKVFVPMLENLLVFEDMDGVTLSQMMFTGTTDKFVPQNGFLSHQALVEKRSMKKVPEAAVLTRNVRRFTARHCEFRELGTNGILMLGKSNMADIRDNYFHGISMAAISVGDPVRVYVNPKNIWASCQKLVKSDPKYCDYDIRIENNTIVDVGYEFPSTPAVQVYRVDGLSICHNTINGCPYSAIHVGWEWTALPYALGEMVNIRDAEIAYNHITNYTKCLYDSAAIYVVGANSNQACARRFNQMHHNYSCNPAIRPKSRGYYLDGSSSGWNVFENVASKAFYPLFVQFIAPLQYTWHNRMDEIYATEAITQENHHPERDTLLGKTYVAPTLEELFEKYPKAKRIMEEAGVYHK